MLFFDPKWGNGCIAFIAGVAGILILSAVLNHFGWSLRALPAPIGQIIGTLIFLAVARFIVNQIFD